MNETANTRRKIISWAYRGRYAVTFGVVSAVASGAQNFATAKDLGMAAPLKAIETYTFVLPAIDCYRTSSLKYTTNDKALNNLLSTAFKNLSNSQLPQSKKAAAQGAAKYDKMVATVGKQGFCAMAVKRYGPKGTVVRGLVVERRG